MHCKCRKALRIWLVFWKLEKFESIRKIISHCTRLNGDQANSLVTRLSSRLSTSVFFGLAVVGFSFYKTCFCNTSNGRSTMVQRFQIFIDNYLSRNFQSKTFRSFKSPLNVVGLKLMRSKFNLPNKISNLMRSFGRAEKP